MTTLKTTALIVAATAAFSAPAFANSLADSLGVDEGRYTYNQLIQLQTAKEADDTIRYNAILSEPRTFDNISSTNPSVVIEHAADNNNTIQEQFLKAVSPAGGFVLSNLQRAMRYKT